MNEAQAFLIMIALHSSGGYNYSFIHSFLSQGFNFSHTLTFIIKLLYFLISFKRAIQLLMEAFNLTSFYPMHSNLLSKFLQEIIHLKTVINSHQASLSDLINLTLGLWQERKLKEEVETIEIFEDQSFHQSFHLAHLYN